MMSYRVEELPKSPTTNCKLEDQGLFFVWSLLPDLSPPLFNLSGTLSPGSIALGFSESRQLPHHDIAAAKVETGTCETEDK